MMIRFRTPWLFGEDGLGRALPSGFQCNDRRSSSMKWETPQAIDFRFGMEITMYIANR